MSEALDWTLAIVNGLVGDRLGQDSADSLVAGALDVGMSLYRQGRRLPLTRAAMAAAYPEAGPRVVLLVHGLMATEAGFRFVGSSRGVDRDGGDADVAGDDYGSLLQRDLGYTPLYLRYNSGRSVADSGAALAALLEALLDVYPGLAPVSELLLLGHSMGGLVLRSACHVAAARGHRWPALVRRAVYLGTPHRGAPLERAGRLLTRALAALRDPALRFVAELGELRSAGIKDLAHGLDDPRQPTPLPAGIAHYFVGGHLSRSPRVGALVGDSMVSVASATDGRTSPTSFSFRADDGSGLAAFHRVRPT